MQLVGMTIGVNMMQRLFLAKRSLQNEMQEILAFMSDELRNDNIKMKIVVDENITTGLNKTDAEMFREMKENNEILKFLSEELDLEI